MIKFRSMQGLGDNIYQRAYIRELDDSEVWLNSPWPEVYEDLPNILYYKMDSYKLRTQDKNMIRHPNLYKPEPRHIGATRIYYADDGIFTGMSRCIDVTPRVFDLPSYGEREFDFDYVLVRPATLRKEWLAASRNPDPIYIQECCDILREFGIRIISVADLQEGEEWLDGEEPYSDIKFHAGELDVKRMLSLVEHSFLCVGSVGWLLPACMAYKKHAWIIFGGYGAYNSPDKLIHPKFNSEKIKTIMPDNFCECRDMTHVCDKSVRNHKERFRSYLEQRIESRLSHR